MRWDWWNKTLPQWMFVSEKLIPACWSKQYISGMVRWHGFELELKILTLRIMGSQVPGGNWRSKQTLQKTHIQPPLFWRVQWFLGYTVLSCQKFRFHDFDIFDLEFNPDFGAFITFTGHAGCWGEGWVNRWRCIFQFYKPTGKMPSEIRRENHLGCKKPGNFRGEKTTNLNWCSPDFFSNHQQYYSHRFSRNSGFLDRQRCSHMCPIDRHFQKDGWIKSKVLLMNSSLMRDFWVFIISLVFIIFQTH